MSEPAAAVASVPVVRALLDEARRKKYRSGVLGVRAQPEWTGAASFVHDEVPVQVVPCVSTLAVREALLERSPGSWLVVLTDRDEDDLGAGVLSHFVWHRLRTPDPWEAVRHRFAATGLDPALTAGPHQRQLASGLLAATPPGGWPPAPGGVLTRDHALACVARAHLALGDPDVDGPTVLRWTLDATVTARLADLRQLGGDALTDDVLGWAASRLGPAAAPVTALLREARGSDVLPLGLAVDVVVDALTHGATDEVDVARLALVRLEPVLGRGPAALAAARTWGPAAVAVLVLLLRDQRSTSVARRLLARADAVLADADATALAVRSDVLPSGLTSRLTRLADTVRRAVPPTVGDPDGALVPATALADVESAWAQVRDHRLASTDGRSRAFHAAVRLTRWLAEPAHVPAPTLEALVRRHNDVDAWVDSAVNDAAPGVGEAHLGAALEAVLAAVRRRRDAHDEAFARTLAEHTENDPPLAGSQHAGVRHLEDLLGTVVLPLARRTPVLFLLLDGMSAGVGTEVVADIAGRAADGWVEALLPGEDSRAAALAVLPTLTTTSRTSLFCGELISGEQGVEQRGYARLAQAHGVAATLFHKKPLDTSRPGHALADDVAAAVDDVDGRRLVSCVLNTIDDALDRSDPGGTAWGAETVKNLEPLLARAREAGRTVVMTADHGHVVERRVGSQRSYPSMTSGRSRAADVPPTVGEVLVKGRRVVAPDSTAVLAVNERLRFGPLKAGYHGGASPAEAVVPVVVLVPGMVPEGTDLTLAAPQEPSWWDGSVALPEPGATLPSPAASAVPAQSRPATDGTMSLFADLSPAGLSPGAGARAGGGGAGLHRTAEAVLAAGAFGAQKALAPRRAVTDAQVARLLSALLSAPANRLTSADTARALGVPPLAVRGALPQVQQLLNVDGYPVLRLDADGSTVVLDEALLRDQFGVRG